MCGTDGLEVYFIQGTDSGKKDEDDEPNGEWSRYGIIVRGAANARTLAHEIGHACGWYDIYTNRKNSAPAELDGFVREGWLHADWNNGTGGRFYEWNLRQSDIIHRLLMYGVGSEEKADLPLGLVHGIGKDGILGEIAVGFRTIITRSPVSW